MGSGGPWISHNVRSQIAWAAAGAGEKGVGLCHLCGGSVNPIAAPRD
jgi:hypothetical protein